LRGAGDDQRPMFWPSTMPHALADRSIQEMIGWG
jgi:hypothetical protein